MESAQVYSENLADDIALQLVDIPHYNTERSLWDKAYLMPSHHREKAVLIQSILELGQRWGWRVRHFGNEFALLI